MTTPNHCTHFYTSCTAQEHDGQFPITGTFDIQANIASTPEELDALIALAEHIGQRVKKMSPPQPSNAPTNAPPHSPKKSLPISTNTANAPSPSSRPTVV